MLRLPRLLPTAPPLPLSLYLFTAFFPSSIMKNNDISASIANWNKVSATTAATSAATSASASTAVFEVWNNVGCGRVHRKCIRRLSRPSGGQSFSET